MFHDTCSKYTHYKFPPLTEKNNTQVDFSTKLEADPQTVPLCQLNHTHVITADKNHTNYNSFTYLQCGPKKWQKFMAP